MHRPEDNIHISTDASVGVGGLRMAGSEGENEFLASQIPVLIHEQARVPEVHLHTPIHPTYMFNMRKIDTLYVV